MITTAGQEHSQKLKFVGMVKKQKKTTKLQNRFSKYTPVLNLKPIIMAIGQVLCPVT